MLITEKDLDNLSILARISIKDEEKAKMLSDIQGIIKYISEINEIDVTSYDEKESLINVMREDVITRESGSLTKALLQNAPKEKDGYVEVEQVLK